MATLLKVKLELQNQDLETELEHISNIFPNLNTKIQISKKTCEPTVKGFRNILVLKLMTLILTRIRRLFHKEI